MIVLAAMPKYEAYKDSGVEWIGKIPRHWKVKKLKFEDKTNMGQSPHSDDCNVDQIGIAFLQGNAEFGTLNPTPKLWCTKPKKHAEIGDVLLSVRAPVGEINVADQRLSIGRGLIAITPSESTNMSFKLYQLISTTAALQRLCTGSTFDAVSGGDVKNLSLPIPPLYEQTTIANFLDKKTTQIDEAIAIKQKQIELLKERKQIIIQKAVTQGLDPNVPLRDSGVDWIGEIPVHWTVLPNFAFFTERVESGRDELPLLSVSIHSGVSKDEISEEENIRGRIKIADKTKYNLVKPNDIVFNMMRAWQGGIGSVTIEGMVSPAYIIATPNNKMNAQYFEYQYRSSIFIQQMDRFSKGITDFRKRLYWDEFKRLNTVAPPIEEQKSIVLHIESSSTKIDKAISLQFAQIKKLKEYKTTLINSAVTGKIKIEHGK